MIENPTKIDDLGVPLFQETTKSSSNTAVALHCVTVGQVEEVIGQTEAIKEPALTRTFCSPSFWKAASTPRSPPFSTNCAWQDQFWMT